MIGAENEIDIKLGTDTLDFIQYDFFSPRMTFALNHLFILGPFLITM